MTLDVNQIMSYLPHRFPFLFVDRILELTEQKVVGIKNVTINEPFFQGHFPGNPIMPGVLIIESMAQAAGLVSLYTSEPGKMGVYLMSIEKAKFRKPVVPGDCLRLDITVLQRRNNVWKMSGVASVDGKEVAEAEFTAMLVKKEN